MNFSTGKVCHAVKANDFLLQKSVRNFTVKFQKFPLVRESKQHKFLKAIPPIYQNYLVKFAVQLRTGTEMILHSDLRW